MPFCQKKPALWAKQCLAHRGYQVAECLSFLREFAFSTFYSHFDLPILLNFKCFSQTNRNCIIRPPFVTTFGHFWPGLAIFWHYWPVLSMFGHLWLLLATSGSFCRPEMVKKGQKAAKGQKKNGKYWSNCTKKKVQNSQ